VTIRFYDVGKFTTLTPLSFILLHKLLFSGFGLKVSCLPSFALRSPKQCSRFDSGIDPIYALVPCKSRPPYRHFNPQQVHSHSPSTSQCYIRHSATNKFYPLNW